MKIKKLFFTAAIIFLLLFFSACNHNYSPSSPPVITLKEVEFSYMLNETHYTGILNQTENGYMVSMLSPEILNGCRITYDENITIQHEGLEYCLEYESRPSNFVINDLIVFFKCVNTLEIRDYTIDDNTTRYDYLYKDYEVSIFVNTDENQLIKLIFSGPNEIIFNFQ